MVGLRHWNVDLAEGIAKSQQYAQPLHQHDATPSNVHLNKQAVYTQPIGAAELAHGFHAGGHGGSPDLRLEGIRQLAFSIAPEILETRWRLTELVLNSPRIMPGIGQRVAAAVAQPGKGIPARSPIRLIRRLMASAVKGPPRSVGKAKPLSGNCRRSSCSALISSPRSG